MKIRIIASVQYGEEWIHPGAVREDIPEDVAGKWIADDCAIHFEDTEAEAKPRRRVKAVEDGNG